MFLFAAHANAYIYWTNGGSGGGTTIGRANLNGTGINQSFIDGAAGVAGLAVDPQHVYWTNTNVGSIGRAGLDGSGVERDFISTPGFLRGVAVNATHIYFSTSNTDSVGRATIDGSVVEPELIPSAESPTGVALTTNFVFWTNSKTTGATIGGANLDGTGVNPTYIPSAGIPIGVAVDGEYIYWTNSHPDANTIGRAELDGTDVDQEFITGADVPYGVAVDDDHIYWANRGADTIGRADVDGSDVDQAFITGADGPNGVAVDAGSSALPGLTVAVGPTASSVGEPMHASATITAGAAPGGALAFALYGPADPDCHGPAAFTAPPVGVSGNGAYASPAFTPTQAGEYRWTVAYSGDAGNDPVAIACDGAATVTVHERPPAEPGSTPRLAIQSKRAKVAGRKVKVRVACLAGDAAGVCRGKLTLKARGKRLARSAKYTVASGERARVKLRLRKPAQRRLKRSERRRMRARARATVVGGDPVKRKLTLIAAGAKRR